MKLYELISKISLGKEYQFENLLCQIALIEHNEYDISNCVKRFLTHDKE